jgi:hypothetical protein
MVAAAASRPPSIDKPGAAAIPTIVLESPMNQHSNVKATDIAAAEQFLLASRAAAIGWSIKRC